MTLGAYLRSLRLSSEQTLEAMALKIGCTKSYLWNIESDKTMPTILKAKAIAKHYKTTLNQMGKHL